MTDVRDEHGHEIVIRFEDIWKSFGRNVIYEGLDLDVRRGETLTFVGGSGTGKSVLLKCLLRLLIPDLGASRRSGSRSRVGTSGRCCPFESGSGCCSRAPLSSTP